MIADPATTADFEPKRAAIRPAEKPTTTIPSVDGRRYSPETTTDAPKPKPVLVGSCANCGKMMKDEYMPAPSRNAVRFVVQTPRIRIIVMSIRGDALRTSTATHAQQTRTPAANNASGRDEVQPQAVVWLTAINTVEIPTLIRIAASQLGRPGIRTGDSGTKRQVQNAATAITTSGSQKSHCHPRCSTITPPATIPTPAPIPRIADRRPMLPATCPAGNSSRTMPNDSGKIPPPTPWITRATISRASVCETAASNVPAPRMRSVQTSTRSLPYASPSLPRIAVPTEAESR